MEKRGYTAGRSEKAASRESERQDSGKRGLQAKVDGERVGLNCREDGPLGRFEDDGAVYKGLIAMSGSTPSFSRGSDGIRGKTMCQQECRSCRTSVSAAVSVEGVFLRNDVVRRRRRNNRASHGEEYVGTQNLMKGSQLMGDFDANAGFRQ